ncbi:MAG TPA: DegT/DnrJ/EryC1/StrS family aminotransferase [Candidatus Dormibacteraeota bacterium]|nr:DegT/DnrJ/EryC1/StrS family aminotransferase [Candidatus Dormibacteraeota bacterium]
MLSLQSRHRLDILFRHFAYALFASAWASDADGMSSRLEAGWSPDGRGLACRSVRSGFHLLLEALALPAGGEVLVSAVTHPDMIRILEAHGLVAVPVDLDTATLAPLVDRAEQLVTPHTEAILIAHLFGGRIDLAPVSAFAQRHGLLLWEDCAQAFTGPGDTGDLRADISMYSFGALKTCTALGGALLKVKDTAVLDRMRMVQSRWRRQGRRAYAAAVLKFFAFSLTTRPIPYGLLARAFGRDFDRVVNNSVRAFRPGPLLPQLELQPSAPLLATLAYRLRTFDAARLRRRARAGEWLAAHLPTDVNLPGNRMESRTHWLFPVVSAQPDSLIRACRQVGIDAARAASSVTVVDPPADRPESEPVAARRMMRGLVFLPAYSERPRRAPARLVAAIGGTTARPYAPVEAAPREVRHA